MPPSTAPDTVWTRATDNGELLTLRRLVPEDVSLALDFINNLSFGDSYFRYGHPGFKLSEDAVRRQCHADPGDSQHYIVALPGASGARIIAAADCCLRVEPESCEFAILVAEDWRRQGIARWLLDRLQTCAREQGTRRLVGKVLSSNAAMLKFARRGGFQIAKEQGDPSITRLVLSLD